MKAGLLLFVITCALAVPHFVPQFKSLPSDPPEQYFEQRLSHFDHQEQRTWQQRYFVNDTFHTHNGPIFLQVGGEGAISPAYVVALEMAQYAKQMGALMVAVEHRFYGKSKPLPDLSTENLKFLSSQEALADLANFIVAFKAARGLEDSPVVTFGGSYPGNLAAWFRIKYPHLTVGSIASSAPVQAELDFYQYLDVVDKSLASVTGEECDARLRAATNVLQNLLKTQQGTSQIESLFRICSPLKSAWDVANFISTIMGNFMGTVQYNGEGSNPVTIKTLCDIMTNSSYQPLDAYAKVSNMFLEAQKQSCLDASYEEMIEEIKSVEQPESGVGIRSWTYQTCVEFGYFQTTDSDAQPFGDLVPLQFSLDICKDVFGFDFLPDINGTNVYYGAKTPVGSTNILFVNGSLDPWHALSVISDLSDTIHAILIDGTAHCANMFPARPQDPPGLALAQKEIAVQIMQWIQ